MLGFLYYTQGEILWYYSPSLSYGKHGRTHPVKLSHLVDKVYYLTYSIIFYLTLLFYFSHIIAGITFTFTCPVYTC